MPIPERSRELQILFYVNGRGGYAVSVDDGETLFLSSGKTIPQAGTVWQEALDEDVEPRLSAQQRQVVAEVRARPPARGVAAITEQYRADRIFASRHYAQPDPEPVSVPESALVIKAEFD